ncbi:hypothetical protein CDV36_000532 [Fusarium kuroshium]|uniref:Uncharacterized protein n=2 Tax=Fusarium solani species complex TaxID=232080 RepID=A0A3M2SQD8_9HYPO|nr:hypothetical protein CDV36_000532 [Fusarium kuroshium]RSL81458.1 hypothetical protein CEP51_005811 [Fusarium floridanum]
MEPLQHRWTVEPILGTTHVPFQLPDVGINGGNNAFSRKATSVLSQITLAGRVIEDEANHFLTSRCWEHLADVPLAYTPADFIAISYNYAIVFGHLELIKKEKPHLLELAPWTLPPRSSAEVTAKTIKSLLQTAATVDTQRISLDASPQDWFDFYQDLSAIETWFMGNANLFQFREQVMKWWLGLSHNLPNRITAQDDERLPVLRSCGHHIGQAFKQGDVSFFPIDCCYVCKLAIGYVEAKAIWIRAMAEDFRMEGRIKLPWSCAEVATST